MMLIRRPRPRSYASTSCDDSFDSFQSANSTHPIKYNSGEIQKSSALLYYSITQKIHFISYFTMMKQRSALWRRMISVGVWILLLELVLFLQSIEALSLSRASFPLSKATSTNTCFPHNKHCSLPALSNTLRQRSVC